MWFGWSVVPFLVQWLGYNSRGSYQLPRQQSIHKNHWELLTELKRFPDNQIEEILPQLCDLLIDEDNTMRNTGSDIEIDEEDNNDVAKYMEAMLIEKCANCLSLGIKTCGLLEAATVSASSRLWFNFINSSPTTLSGRNQRNERIRELLNRFQTATMYGSFDEESDAMKRSSYFKEQGKVVAHLAKLGIELKALPVDDRLTALRESIIQVNSYLLGQALVTPSGKVKNQLKLSSDVVPNVMQNKRAARSSAHKRHVPSSSEEKRLLSGGTYRQDDSMRSLALISGNNYGRFLPTIHYPVFNLGDKVLRVLRFVESECKILPSRERCPYLLVAEILMQPISYESKALYGGVDENILNSAPKVTAEDVAAYIAPSRVINESDHEGIHHSTRYLLHGRWRQQIRSRSAGFSSSKLLKAARFDGNSKSHQEMTYSTRLQQTHRFVNVVLNQDTADRSDIIAAAKENDALAKFQSNDRDLIPFPFSGHVDARSKHSRRFRPLTSFLDRKMLIQDSSEYGRISGWDLKGFIVKSGDDIRKEVVAMQFIQYCKTIFSMEGVDILLKPYDVICTGHNSGVIEYLATAHSIDHIKKAGISPDEEESSTIPTLSEYYAHKFGPPTSLAHSEAVNNFVRSLAGYSLITYVLQVKDRHNANILIDDDGSIIHIDFGFILGESPGLNINFETAPFKLTREYVELMGGVDSVFFKQFEDRVIAGFRALQKHINGLYALLKASRFGNTYSYSESLRARLLFARSSTDISELVRDSLDNWRTKQYDWFQHTTNRILP